MLVERGRAHFADCAEAVLQRAAELVARDREEMLRADLAPPGLVVRALGRGEILRRVPRLTRVAWAGRASVWIEWIDRSDRLVPLLLGHRIAVLEAGKITQTGTWEELSARGASRFVEEPVDPAGVRE